MAELSLKKFHFEKIVEQKINLSIIYYQKLSDKDVQICEQSSSNTLLHNS